MTQSSVLLLSGGLDSAANLAFAHAKGERIHAVFVDYGQRAVDSERRASRSLAGYYGAGYQEIHLRWLGALGGSSLTDRTATVPSFAPAELDDAVITRESARSVWVPNRNGLFLQVAAAVAERNEIHSILVGFNAEEAVTFPDNSADFMQRSTNALFLSTRNHVQVRSFTVSLRKPEIVARLRGLSRPFPFDSVWSCYQAGTQACGVCESCQRYRRAIGEA